MDQLPITPVFARVIILREKKEKMGSIIVPDSSVERHTPAKGKLLACGEATEDSIVNAIGKTVYFAQFSGAWLKVGEGEDVKEYYICQDEDIIAIEG